MSIDSMPQDGSFDQGSGHTAQSYESGTSSVPKQQGARGNPTSATSAPLGSGAGLQDSVVPDLMKVYDNMVGHNPSHSDVWTMQNTTSISIPPIPANIEEAMKYAASSGSQGEEPPEKPSETRKGPSGRSSSGRKLRKRSASNASQPPIQESTSPTTRGPKSRRKNKETDGRWSKRFSWPENLHRDFVSAIFDVGLKHSSPSAILEHMPEHEQINSERVKSHLQKYRLNRSKSKKEFMASYDACLAQMQKDGAVSKSGPNLSGGEVAAQVAYNAMSTNSDSVQEETEAKEQMSSTPENPPTASRRKSTQEDTQQEEHDTILIPKLTEEEKKTPIGASVGYLMGLFFTLKKQLTLQRETQALAAAREAERLKAGSMMDDIQKSFGPVAAQQPAAYDVSGTSALPGDTKSNAAVGSPNAAASRVNIKESTMMKREMQYQMAFQNKMRLLKQQEEQKLASKPVDHTASEPLQTSDEPQLGADGPADIVEQQQGAGEHQGEGRHRGLSISEDFWYTDVVDDQLFEFLMNN